MKLTDLEVAHRHNLRTWFSGEHWRERIISFNASWFVLTMGTGVVVQVLASFPYPAQWLRNLAYCFWVLDVLIFLFFVLMFIARLILFPSLTKSLYLDFIQTSYLGAIPITLDTIIVGITIWYSDRPAAVWAAWGIWWVAVVLSLFVGSLVVVIACAYQDPHELSSVTGIWLLSFIPFIVTSGVGGFLVPHLNVACGTATLIISFLFWTVGVFMAHMILAIYLYRLISCSLPAREAIVSCFIPMGPTGMGAYSIQLQAAAYASILRRTSFTFTQPTAGGPPLDTASHHAIIEAVYWIGVLVGLCLMAEATFWLIFAVSAVIIRIPRHFNVGFWSFVFPCGVYTNSVAQLANNFRNEGFKGWAATMSVVTVLLWCLCAACTVYKSVWHAQLLFAPGLEGWNERMALRKMHDEREQRTDDSSKQERMGSDAQRSQSSEEAISLNNTDMVNEPWTSNAESSRPIARVSQPDGSYLLARLRAKVLPV